MPVLVRSICSRSTIQRVDCVVAAADQTIVSGLTIKRIVSCAAEQRVISAAPNQDVVAIVSPR